MQGSAAYRCTVGRWLDQPAALSHQHEPEHNVSLSTYLVPSVAAYHRSSRWSWNHWSRATSACTHIVRVPPVQKSKAKHRNQQCIPTQHCRAIQTLTLALTSQCSRAAMGTQTADWIQCVGSVSDGAEIHFADSTPKESASVAPLWNRL